MKSFLNRYHSSLITVCLSFVLPELPQQQVHEEVEDVCGQQLCSQEDSDPSESEEGQQEVSSRQEEEMFFMKQEAGAYTFPPVHGENDQSEEQMLSFNPHETGVESLVNMIFESRGETHPCGPDGPGDTGSAKPAYICRTCGQSFPKFKLLSHHVNAAHAGQARFPCKMCGATFKYSSDLRTHMRKHTGERRYLCKLCGRRFYRGGHLKNHMRAHTDERPYSCSICGSRFRQQTTLRHHLTTHTGEKPHSCSLCDMRFSRKWSLNRHLKTHKREMARFAKLGLHAGKIHTEGE